MAQQHTEFELKRVVVSVYAPLSWTDKQTVDALEGNGWDFAAERLNEMIKNDMDEMQRDCTMPEGLRIEVTS